MVSNLQLHVGYTKCEHNTILRRYPGISARAPSVDKPFTGIVLHQILVQNFRRVRKKFTRLPSFLDRRHMLTHVRTYARVKDVKQEYLTVPDPDLEIRGGGGGGGGGLPNNSGLPPLFDYM